MLDSQNDEHHGKAELANISTAEAYIEYISPVQYSTAYIPRPFFSS